ncbi:MAG: DedA family protein [Candidatus Ancillula trichonymphae]|jgi:membrane protein DedA with SNARE-associated domain|nr:DedA family protein [Candidatus Ancillula trichonymphae]
MDFCPATGLVGQIVSSALWIIFALGILGAGLVVAVENILPFIPSEVILPTIGFAAVGGVFHIRGIPGVVFALVVVTFASILGVLVLFFISRKIGVAGITKLPFLKKHDVENAVKTFEKHGDLAVLFCRFLPVVRVLVTIPAGISAMKVRTFLLFTFLGSLVWNTVLIGFGAYVGSSWCDIEPVFSRYSKITLLVVVLIFVIAYVFKSKWHKSGSSKDG